MFEETRIIDMLPELIWTNDSNGKANYFSESWYRYTGLTYEQSEGAGWVAVAHGDDAHAVEEWRKAFHEQRIFKAESRLRNKENKYEWHLLTNMPYRDQHQNVVAWFGSATNVHRLKEQELATAKTAAYLKAILDTAVDFAIISLDDKGTIIGWNAGAEKMFGYSETEIIGRPTGVLFTGEDLAGGVAEEELNRARTTGRSLDERWHMRKDGSRFFMSGVLTPMKDFKGFVKITRDITDRKLSEEALLLAEHRNNMAMDSAHMGEWTWDVAAQMILLDGKAQQILEVQEDKISEEAFLRNVHSDDVAGLQQEFEKSINGLNVFQSELRIVGKSGKVKWINWYGRVLSQQSDTPRMMGVVYDITERKALEKQKDEFISIASHELKTPVTSIKMYTEHLLESFSESQQEQNADVVRKLNAQVDRLIRLFHVLIDSKRISEGGITLNIETFDLNDLVAEQVSDFTQPAQNRNLIFKPATIGLVKADRERIGQVIANFLTNAIKYSREADIIVSSEDAMDGAVVKVQDFGPGIAAEDKAHVFNQYFRGSGNKTKEAGFGLGLYIAAEIVRQHHGLIGIDSVPGEGATFYFKLFYT